MVTHLAHCLLQYTAGMYILRRRITIHSTGLSNPLINFSTQYIPVMTGMVKAFIHIAFISSIRSAPGKPGGITGIRNSVSL